MPGNSRDPVSFGLLEQLWFISCCPTEVLSFEPETSWHHREQHLTALFAFHLQVVYRKHTFLRPLKDIGEHLIGNVCDAVWAAAFVIGHEPCHTGSLVGPEKYLVGEPRGPFPNLLDSSQVVMRTAAPD